MGEAGGGADDDHVGSCLVGDMAELGGWIPLAYYEVAVHRPGAGVGSELIDEPFLKPGLAFVYPW